MKFDKPLVQGTLIKRYKRFLADVELADGQVVTAHVANSGSMLGINVPGLEVWLTDVAGPGRKLAWSWDLARVDGALVGVNTGFPNRVAAEAIAVGQIPELAGYGALRREVKYGANSRIDILLENAAGPSCSGASPCYVEVKSVTLKNGAWAEFPDAVTVRGTKHLHELRDQVALGRRAVMLYLVSRSDCATFRPAAAIDPVYAAALTDAVRDGVEAICYSCKVDLEGIAIGQEMPVVIG